jgi:hypothetical protein
VPNTVRAISFHENGEIHEGDVYDYVSVYDNAIVNMTGGSVTIGISAYDSSTVNMSNGFVSYLSGIESSAINLTGNAFINDVLIVQTSFFSMTGGTVGRLDAETSGGTYLYNGIISDYLLATNNVNIYGYGFIYDADAGEHSGGQLTGFWGDGTQFNIDLVKYSKGGTPPVDTWTQISLHEIPEPVTLLFFILGAGFLPRKK